MSFGKFFFVLFFISFLRLFWSFKKSEKYSVQESAEALKVKVFCYTFKDSLHKPINNAIQLSLYSLMSKHGDFKMALIGEKSMPYWALKVKFIHIQLFKISGRSKVKKECLSRVKKLKVERSKRNKRKKLLKIHFQYFMLENWAATQRRKERNVWEVPKWKREMNQIRYWLLIMNSILLLLLFFHLHFTISVKWKSSSCAFEEMKW